MQIFYVVWKLIDALDLLVKVSVVFLIFFLVISLVSLVVFRRRGDGSDHGDDAHQ